MGCLVFVGLFCSCDLFALVLLLLFNDGWLFRLVLGFVGWLFICVVWLFNLLLLSRFVGFFSYLGLA